jgi:hypothetical protein
MAMVLSVGKSSSLYVWGRMVSFFAFPLSLRIRLDNGLALTSSDLSMSFFRAADIPCSEAFETAWIGSCFLLSS